MKSKIIIINLIVNICFAQLPFPFNLVKDIKFYMEGNRDVYIGKVIVKNEYFVIHGTGNVKTTVLKYNIDGVREWILIPNDIYAYAMPENMVVTKDDEIIFQTVPMLDSITYTYKVDKNGNIMIKDSTLPPSIMALYGDTIIFITIKDIYFISKDLKIIRRYGFDIYRTPGVNPRVYGNYLYLNAEVGGFGTYVDKYDLNDSIRLLWRFYTPEDSFRSFRIRMDIDSKGNVYVAGNKINVNGGKDNIFVYSLDNNGYLRWYKEFYPMGTTIGFWVRCIKVVNDSIIVIGGSVMKNKNYFDPNSYQCYLAFFSNDGKFIGEVTWEQFEGEYASVVEEIGYSKDTLIVVGRSIFMTNPEMPGFIRYYHLGNDIIDTTASDTTISDTTSTSKDTTKHIPQKYFLHQNYPNPFNSETTIEFDLPEKVNVKLVVYDILGRKVAVLVDEELPEGKHRVKFDAGNLPSGVYIYELRSGRYRSVKKMVVVK